MKKMSFSTKLAYAVLILLAVSPLIFGAAYLFQEKVYESDMKEYKRELEAYQVVADSVYKFIYESNYEKWISDTSLAIRKVESVKATPEYCKHISGTRKNGKTRCHSDWRYDGDLVCEPMFDTAYIYVRCGTRYDTVWTAGFANAQDRERHIVNDSRNAAEMYVANMPMKKPEYSGHANGWMLPDYDGAWFYVVILLGGLSLISLIGLIRILVFRLKEGRFPERPIALMFADTDSPGFYYCDY